MPQALRVAEQHRPCLGRVATNRALTNPARARRTRRLLRARLLARLLLLVRQLRHALLLARLLPLVLRLLLLLLRPRVHGVAPLVVAAVLHRRAPLVGAAVLHRREPLVVGRLVLAPEADLHVPLVHRVAVEGVAPAAERRVGAVVAGLDEARLDGEEAALVEAAPALAERGGRHAQAAEAPQEPAPDGGVVALLAALDERVVVGLHLLRELAPGAQGRVPPRALQHEVERERLRLGRVAAVEAAQQFRAPSPPVLLLRHVRPDVARIVGLARVHEAAIRAARARRGRLLARPEDRQVQGVGPAGALP